MPYRLTLSLFAALALALPASAVADPAYEPNNGIHQAFGPLEANKDYDAVISSSNDVDWYIVYVSGAGVLDTELTNIASTGSWTEVTLRDRDGGYLLGKEVEPGTSEDIVYTTPGAGHYYVEVDGSAGDDYGLRVTGPVTGGPRPGPVDEVTPNNNPDLATAFGPLLGGRLYGGSIDASGEEDWFYFYTAGAGTFDVALTNINDTSSWTEIRLHDGDGKDLLGDEVGPDTIGHLRYTVPGPAKFVLQVDGGAPNQYQFRIDPAGLLTTVPPPPPPLAAVTKRGANQACKRTRATRKKAFANFKKAQRKRAIAKRKSRSARRAKPRRNWRKAQRRWTKATKKRRVVLTKTNQRMKNACA